MEMEIEIRSIGLVRLPSPTNFAPPPPVDFCLEPQNRRQSCDVIDLRRIIATDLSVSPSFSTDLHSYSRFCTLEISSEIDPVRNRE